MNSIEIDPALNGPPLPASSVSALWILLRHETRLAVRRRSELAIPLLFFAIVVTLFPLALGPNLQTLSGIAAGVVWVAAFLSVLLAVDALFRDDFEDGCLEQYALLPQSVVTVVLAKATIGWLITGLPLALSAPILASSLGMPLQASLPLAASLLLGSISLILIGTVGVALTVGLRRSGMLLTLILAPLYVPVLIFGARVGSDAAQGLSVSAALFILAAMAVLALTLAPFAAAAALRVVLE